MQRGVEVRDVGGGGCWLTGSRLDSEAALSVVAWLLQISHLNAGLRVRHHKLGLNSSWIYSKHILVIQVRIRPP